MNTKTLSDRALSTIEQYERFAIAKAICSVPYFNNKVTRSRASLRTLTGKGSPRDIHEEIMGILIKGRVDQNILDSESLKKILTDNNIGIDCSGFAYYILNAESESQNKGPLDKHLHFVNCHGLFGKMRCALRPVENCDVSTLANDKNSKVVSINELQPGDIITMQGGPENIERDHILVIYQIEYQNFVPTKLHYAHAVAYPTDGIYGTGIKKGLIQIADVSKNIIEQIWSENEKTGEENTIFVRAKSSNTELRRIKL